MHNTEIIGLWLLPMPLCEEKVWQFAHNLSGKQQPLQLKLLLRNKMKKQNKTETYITWSEKCL